MTTDAPLPRTDAAKDFSAPEKMYDESQKLERDLTAACGVLKKADRGFILGLACMGVHGQRDENGLCGKSLERWNELVEIQNKTNVFLARMKESGNG